MKPTRRDAVFRPSKGEQKGEATTRAARAIIDNERDAQEAKTERLRLLRQERDAASPPIVPGAKANKAAKAIRKIRAGS